jgi:N-acetylglutamate synthase-like GNAT family acetyltransferase
MRSLPVHQFPAEIADSSLVTEWLLECGFEKVDMDNLTCHLVQSHGHCHCHCHCQR